MIGRLWFLVACLQGADGRFKRQSVRFEEFCRRTTPLADECRQHDGAIDLRALNLARGFGCGPQDFQEIFVGCLRCGFIWCDAVLQLPEVGRDVLAQALRGSGA